MPEYPRVNTYVETHALLAVMDEDHDTLAELLDGMLCGELRQLAVYARQLGAAAESAIRRQHRTAPDA